MKAPLKYARPGGVNALPDRYSRSVALAMCAPATLLWAPVILQFVPISVGLPYHTGFPYLSCIFILLILAMFITSVVSILAYGPTGPEPRPWAVKFNLAIKVGTLLASVFNIGVVLPLNSWGR